MVVVDTSVAMKWFLPELGYLEARDLLESGEIVVPDLLLYEFSNVLSCHHELSLEEINRILKLFFEIHLQILVLPEKGFCRAIELSRTLKISAYDASFVALAESLKVDLITADQKLVRKTTALGFVQSL